MAQRYDFTIEQGATFQLAVTLKTYDNLPLPLTGYTARCQLRKNFTAATAIEVTATIPAPLTGQVHLALSATATAALGAPAAYLYDLEVEDAGGVVTRVLEGKAVITPNITRPVEVVL